MNELKKLHNALEHRFPYLRGPISRIFNDHSSLSVGFRQCPMSFCSPGNTRPDFSSRVPRFQRRRFTLEFITGEEGGFTCRNAESRQQFHEKRLPRCGALSRSRTLQVSVLVAPRVPRDPRIWRWHYNHRVRGRGGRGEGKRDPSRGSFSRR